MMACYIGKTHIIMEVGSQLLITTKASAAYSLGLNSTKCKVRAVGDSVGLRVFYSPF